MSGDDRGAGYERSVTRRRVGDRRCDARRRFLQTPAAVLQRRAAALGPLEPLPLRGDGASDIGEQGAGLRLGPVEQRPRLVGREPLGLSSSGQPRRRLGLAALELADAVGLRAVAGVELRKELAEPSRVGGAESLGAQDQRPRQSEPGGDRQRPRLTGAVVDQPERRSERGGVELDRGIARARLRGGERAEGLEVRGGDDQRATIREHFEDRPRQRRALVGIGARAELIEQDERALIGLGEHLADLLDERGERREVLGDRLIVADDGEDPFEHRHARALRRGDVAAGLRHQREQRERFERDRLAAGVRAGDEQQRSIGRQLEIHRHDLAGRIAPLLREQQRVARGLEIHATVTIDGRPRGLHALGQMRTREDPVERTQRLDERRQRLALSAHGVGQLGEDAGRFLLLVALEGDEVVVRLDHRFRLDEQRLAALRAVVHDAAQSAAGFRAQREHVAPVAHRHEAIGEHAVALRLQQSLEICDETPASLTELPTQLAEPRAGAIGQRAVVVERLAQALAQLVHTRERFGAGGQRGGDGADRASIGAHARRRVE